VSAYTAGIVDGEGCITIAKQKTARVRAGYIYQLKLQVESTDKDLITWLNSHWNRGSCGIQELVQTNTKHNTRWRTVWSSAKAATVLKAILPYLVIKKDQAELAIQFQDARGRERPRSVLGLIVDSTYYNILKNMHQKVYDHN